MRRPQRLTARSGEAYYRVRYRRGGKERSLSFWGSTAEADADEFAGLINTLGVEKAVAWWNANLDRDEAEASLTLDEWFSRYLPSVTGITDGTRLTYRRTYDRVWSKPLGSTPLTLLTREDIAKVVNEMNAADKTIRNAFGVLSTALKVAVRDGHLPASPAAGIKLPRRTEHTDTEMRFLTHDEWSRLERCLPHYRPLFTMLVGTGMRWGEAEALTVGDIVLKPDPVVRINKAAKWNASKATREIGPTKTRRSRRTVTLPPEVVESVKPLLDRPASTRLFVAVKGGELRHSKVYPLWIDACERAGLGEWQRATKTTKRKWLGPRIHDLRHTHVAWLIAAGVPLPVIQARLGHENISTTIDRFGHLLPDLQRAAADAASLAMRGITAGPKAIAS